MLNRREAHTRTIGAGQGITALGEGSRTRAWSSTQHTRPGAHMGQLQWQAGGRSWRLGDYDKRRRTDENERENIPGEREQSGKKGVEQMRNEGWETRENKERRTPSARRATILLANVDRGVLRAGRDDVARFPSED
eukprot:scaffold193621_cov24-Tisochrysis_lutea.AAC.1